MLDSRSSYPGFVLNTLHATNVDQLVFRKLAPVKIKKARPSTKGRQHSPEQSPQTLVIRL